MPDFVPETIARALMPKELLAQASSLHLCLHVHPTWVFATVAEAASVQVLWTESFHLEHTATEKWADVIQFLIERNWADKVFRKCTLTFDTPEFTLVPSAFFEREKEQALLEFHTGRTHQHVSSLSISELNADLIFDTDAAIRQLIPKFPNVRIFPTAYLFARYALLFSPRDESSIHAFHAPGQLLLCIYKNRQLQLLNHYTVQGEEDVLYFVSNAAMQLNIDMEHVALKLYAHESDKKTLALLKNYNRTAEQSAHQSLTPQPIITQMHLTCA